MTGDNDDPFDPWGLKKYQVAWRHQHLLLRESSSRKGGGSPKAEPLSSRAYQSFFRFCLVNNTDAVAYYTTLCPDLASIRDGTTGLTPLHYAVSSGSLGVVDILIDRGADVFARDRWNRTPFRLADEAGQHECADRLADEMAREAFAQESTSGEDSPE